MAVLFRPKKAYICSALCLWLFTSVILLIVSTYFYLTPFLKVARLKETLCRVEGSYFTTQYMCSCGSNCQSSYPCFVLHVSLPNVTSHEGHLWVVTLYTDDQQQAKVLNAEQDSREPCSIKYCHKDLHYNGEMIDTFKSTYGHADNEFMCYYDPSDVGSGTVLEVQAHLWFVFHTVFWPCLSIFVGTITCCVFCKKCRQIEEQKALGQIEEAKSLAERPVLPRNAAKFPKTHKQRSLRSLWL